MIIRIPFKPREHQKEIIDHLKRFNVLVCHRRFGKTALSVNLLIRACLEKPNQYCAYIAPTMKQALDVAWHSPHTSIKRYIRPLLDSGKAVKYENDGRVVFYNGSVLRLFGVDDPDRLRGIGLNAVILDEVVKIKSNVWSEIIFPALSDQKGWAIFISTPKGMNNLFYDVFENAQKEENSEHWYSAVYKASDTSVLDKETLDLAKNTMPPEEYDQEYQCSFEGSLVGSYFGSLITEARKDSRIGRFPWRSDRLVHCSLDLGRTDATAIWFYQKDHQGIFFIDYYEDSDEPLQYYLKYLKEKPYAYGKLYLPHDIKITDYTATKSRLRIVRDFGFKPKVVKKLSIEEGINKVRTLFSRCYFDALKCEYGLDALFEYRKEEIEKLKVKKRQTVYKNHPRHDWTSHAADAFRYFAVGYKEPGPKRQPKKSTRYKIFK